MGIEEISLHFENGFCYSRQVRISTTQNLNIFINGY